MTTTIPGARAGAPSVRLRPAATRARRRLRGAWNRARRADFEFLEVDRGGFTENRVELLSGATARALTRVTPPRRVTVPVAQLLVGGEDGATAKQLAGVLGDPMRPSTFLAQAPLVELLRDYHAQGEAVLGDAHLLATRAFRDMTAHAHATGHTHNDDAVLNELRHTIVDASVAWLEQPVPVRRVRNSEYLQVQATSLGLLNVVARGAVSANAVIVPGTVTTPLQDLLLQMSSMAGTRQIYQPVPAPELTQSWPLVRQCTERLEMMQAFLRERALPGEPSYLDVASCYGWFVAEMRNAGFRARGVERDTLAIRCGRWVFGLAEDDVEASDAEPYLATVDQPFDVVSCFSLLHHLVMFEGESTAAALVQQLDRVTAEVLFIDTGEAHESWLSNLDPQWEPRFIQRWLVEHTTFTEVVALGTDQTLFACVR